MKTLLKLVGVGVVATLGLFYYVATQEKPCEGVPDWTYSQLEEGQEAEVLREIVADSCGYGIPRVHAHDIVEQAVRTSVKRPETLSYLQRSGNYGDIFLPDQSIVDGALIMRGTYQSKAPAGNTVTRDYRAKLRLTSVGWTLDAFDVL